MNRLSIARYSTAVMVFGVVTYAVSYIWQALSHTAFTDSAFATAFPGFSWSATGFMVGLGWSIVYSVYIGVVFAAAYSLAGRTTVEARTQQTTR